MLSKKMSLTFKEKLPTLLKEMEKEHQLYLESRTALTQMVRENQKLSNENGILTSLYQNILDRIEELKRANPDDMTKDRALDLLRVEVKGYIKEMIENANV